MTNINVKSFFFYLYSALVIWLLSCNPPAVRRELNVQVIHKAAGLGSRAKSNALERVTLYLISAIIVVESRTWHAVTFQFSLWFPWFQQLCYRIVSAQTCTSPFSTYCLSEFTCLTQSSVIVQAGSRSRFYLVILLCCGISGNSAIYIQRSIAIDQSLNRWFLVVP